MRPVRARASRALATALLAAWAWFVPPPALAQADPAQQRARIAAERAQTNTVLADRERACLPQFVAAPCREAARNEQRATLKRLRGEEMALDEAQRTERAARRRELLADKAAARQSRTAAVDASTAQRAPAEAASPRAEPAAPASASVPKERKKRAARGTAGPAPGRAEDAGRRAALEAQNVAAFEARARAAQVHREAVALRNSRRTQGSEGANAARRSAPLPTPTPAPTPTPTPATVFPAVAVPAPVAASRPVR